MKTAITALLLAGCMSPLTAFAQSSGGRALPLTSEQRIDRLEKRTNEVLEELLEQQRNLELLYKLEQKDSTRWTDDHPHSNVPVPRGRPH